MWPSGRRRVPGGARASSGSPSPCPGGMACLEGKEVFTPVSWLFLKGSGLAKSQGSSWGGGGASEGFPGEIFGSVPSPESWTPEPTHPTLPTRRSTCSCTGAGLLDRGQEAQKTRGSLGLMLQTPFLGRGPLADAKGPPRNGDQQRQTPSTCPRHRTPEAWNWHHLSHSVPINDPPRCDPPEGFCADTRTKPLVTSTARLSFGDRSPKKVPQLSLSGGVRAHTPSSLLDDKSHARSPGSDSEAQAVAITGGKNNQCPEQGSRTPLLSLRSPRLLPLPICSASIPPSLLSPPLPNPAVLGGGTSPLISSAPMTVSAAPT